jgi:hypothetical protein
MAEIGDSFLSVRTQRMVHIVAETYEGLNVLNPKVRAARSDTAAFLTTSKTNLPGEGFRVILETQNVRPFHHGFD